MFDQVKEPLTVLPDTYSSMNSSIDDNNVLLLHLLIDIGALAGIGIGSLVALILFAISLAMVIYKWYQRKHGRVIHVSQRTMRKLSADLERFEGMQ